MRLPRLELVGEARTRAPRSGVAATTAQDSLSHRERAGVRERSIAALMLLLAALVGTPCPGAVISFGEIAGARRDEGTRWCLALGTPPDAAVLASTVDLTFTPGQAVPLVAVPATFSGGEFTVVLELAEVSAGVVRLACAGAPGDTRSVLVSRDGWVALCCGPVVWTGTATLTVSATAAMRVRQVTVLRTFEQLYGKGGTVDLVGAAYHKLGGEELLSAPLLPAADRQYRSGQWARPATGVQHGIGVGRLEQSYCGLLCGPDQDEVGLPVPVRAPGGVVLSARIFGHLALITHREQGPHNLTWGGEADRWSTCTVHLDGGELDDAPNGLYTGRHKHPWHVGRTWVENYGSGLIDYAVMLPQNEIAVSAGGRARLSLQYEADGGLKPLSLDLPADTAAVALLNVDARRTQVIARCAGKYTPLATIGDGRPVGCLAVKPGSLQVEPVPAR